MRREASEKTHPLRRWSVRTGRGLQKGTINLLIAKLFQKEKKERRISKPHLLRFLASIWYNFRTKSLLWSGVNHPKSNTYVLCMGPTLHLLPSEILSFRIPFSPWNVYNPLKHSVPSFWQATAALFCISPAFFGLCMRKHVGNFNITYHYLSICSFSICNLAI